MIRYRYWCSCDGWIEHGLQQQHIHQYPAHWYDGIWPGVTNAIITGNTYTGKGDGDWLDYGVEVGGGAGATITNNNISNNTGVASSDSSTSAGILVTVYYGSGTTATITGNTLTGNSTGLAVGYDSADASAVTAEYNRFIDNEFNIVATSATVETDASPNWFGSISGLQKDQ